MKTIPIKLLSALLLTTLSLSAQVDSARFLSAISYVETRNRNELIGKAGERSAYQFMPIIWKFHSNLPFEIASINRQEADRVALAHFNYLASKLTKMGKDVTPYNLALCWNAGETRVRRNNLLDSHHRYARMVVEKYEDQKN